MRGYRAGGVGLRVGLSVHVVVAGLQKAEENCTRVALLLDRYTLDWTVRIR